MIKKAKVRAELERIEKEAQAKNKREAGGNPDSEAKKDNRETENGDEDWAVGLILFWIQASGPQGPDVFSYGQPAENKKFHFNAEILDLFPCFSPESVLY